MQKYNKEFVDKINKGTDLVKLVQELGAVKNLVQYGNDWLGTCPFIETKEPTFVIFGEPNYFKCFSCGANGYAVDFLSQYCRISKDDAVEVLAHENGIQITEADYETLSPMTQRIVGEMKQACEEACKIFQENLSDKNCQNYIKQRELSQKTINEWRIGFAPDSWSFLSEKLTKNFSAEVLDRAGLIRQKEHGTFDFFRNRLMFPIEDRNGDICGFSGRTIATSPETADHKIPKYLNSPESDIFHKGEILFGMDKAQKTKQSFFIICEGQMDVIALHQIGLDNAVASLGTSLTDQHIEWIATQKKKGCCLSYDSDEAGQKAIDRALKSLYGITPKIKVINMDPCKDPDEFLKTFGKKEYIERVITAKDALTYKIESLSKQYDMTDMAQKEAFIKKAVSDLSFVSYKDSQRLKPELLDVIDIG